MTDVLTTVLADLAAEGDALEALVAGLDEDGWRTPTPAAGWDVAAQVAHLAWTDEVAVKAATDKEAWDAVVLLGAGQTRTASSTPRRWPGPRRRPRELLARWRAGRACAAGGAARRTTEGRCRGSGRRCRRPRWRPRGSWRPGRTASTSTRRSG